MRLYSFLSVISTVAIFALVGCGEREYPERTTGLSKVEVVSNDDSFMPVFKVDKDENEEVEPVSKEIEENELMIQLESEIFEDLPDEEEITPDIIERAKNYEPEKPVNEINLDNGFKYVGRYVEDGCLTKMHKKEYEISWLYIHVDCKGRRSKYHKNKEK